LRRLIQLARCWWFTPRKAGDHVKAAGIYLFTRKEQLEKGRTKTDLWAVYNHALPSALRGMIEMPLLRTVKLAIECDIFTAFIR